MRREILYFVVGMCYSRKNLNKGGWLSLREFPVVNHQKRREISWGDQEKIMWNFQGYCFLWQKQQKKSRFFNPLPWLDFFWNNSLLMSWAHHYARYIVRAPTDQSTTYLKLKAASYVNRKNLGRHFFYKWLDYEKLLPVTTDMCNMI